MEKILKHFCATCISVLTLHVEAQTIGAPNIDATTLTQAAEAFLKEQIKPLQSSQSQLEANVKISVNKPDPRLKLQACDDLKPFLTPGSKAWGKITIGIQCSAPKSWTIYLAANVMVFGDYFVTSKIINMGQVLTEQDLVKLQGEVSSLPASIITDEKQAIGKTMLATYPAGVSLRKEMFKIIPVIQQGQSIKVSSTGFGFTVSNEAIALNNAAEGQIAKAKTASGQVISGIARMGGVIEVN